MAKPEWGQKRNCNSCGCRFYDMGRSPVTCPKCGGTVETDLPFKVRRGGSAQAETKVVAPVAVASAGMDADDLPGDDEDEALDGDDEAAEDDEMIEDTSDLGEDDDDMAEVMEHLDEEIEDEV